MKKILAMLLALICAFSLFACGSDERDDEDVKHNHENSEKETEKETEKAEAEKLDLMVRFRMPDEDNENEYSDFFRYEFETETEEDYTVLDAVEYALEKYEIDYALTTDGDYFERIRKYGGDKRETRAYWQFYYNGELCDEKQSDILLEDGDVVEYRWVSGKIEKVSLIFTDDAEKKDIFKYEIPELVPDENGSINIISAVRLALNKYEKDYSLDFYGSNIEGAFGYTTYERVDAEKAAYGYWECYLNGEQVKVSQNTVELEDDDVIEFHWIEGELLRQDIG